MSFETLFKGLTWGGSGFWRAPPHSVQPDVLWLAYMKQLGPHADVWPEQRHCTGPSKRRGGPRSSLGATPRASGRRTLRLSHLVAGVDVF